MNNEHDDDPYGADGKPVEDASGATRVRMRANALGAPDIRMAARIVPLERDQSGMPRFPKGSTTTRVSGQEINRIGGRVAALTDGNPLNHPLVRPGAPLQPLGYDPTSHRATGSTKEVESYLHLRSRLANSAQITSEVPAVMYYWAQRGVAPPEWLESLVAGRPGGAYVASYAARLRAAMQGG